MFRLVLCISSVICVILAQDPEVCSEGITGQCIPQKGCMGLKEIGFITKHFCESIDGIPYVCCVRHFTKKPLQSSPEIPRANCRQSEQGLEYQGTQALAANGEPCLYWADVKGVSTNFWSHKERRIAENYCRNPSGVARSPWCYVASNPKPRLQYCDIPFCPGVRQDLTEGWPRSLRSKFDADSFPLSWSSRVAVPFAVSRGRENKFLGLLAKFRKIPRPGDHFRFYCGATVIRQKFLLTSAHCMGADGTDLPIIARTAELNITDPHDWHEEQASDHPVDKVFIHPQYKFGVPEFDLAVVKLRGRNPGPPMALPRYRLPLENGRSKGNFIGWLFNQHDPDVRQYEGRRSDVPVTQEVPIWSHEECAKLYGHLFAEFQERDPANTVFCAGTPGYCRDDSGGAFLYDLNEDGTDTKFYRQMEAFRNKFHRDETFEEYQIPWELKQEGEDRFVLAGVASTVLGDCEGPQLYTRVDAHLEWIVRTIVQNE